MGRQSLYPARRDHLLAVIDTLTAPGGPPPSLREVAGRLGIGVSTVHAYLTRLAEEGVVEWHPKSHRTLRRKRTQTSRRLPPAPF